VHFFAKGGDGQVKWETPGVETYAEEELMAAATTSPIFLDTPPFCDTPGVD